ncbi:MAG: bifunctional phosphopantothenoylcysteine decarboxylase/phosphopantothenate--cysteine ligase CoaBC [Patescibacteria group bacterium]
MKDKKTIIVGVTSGIAAYKTLDLVRLLKKDGADVFVVMTKSAKEMVPTSKFEKASGNRVYSELFEKGFDYRDILKIRLVDHINLADKADIVVVAPATANCIAKIAHGMADDFLTTMLLATTAPIIVCPSMNVHMWENNIVSDNINKLRLLGYRIIEPEEGQLACGYQGKGRLAHTQHIKDEIYSILKKREQLRGKKILVTSGSTIEKIDDVRYIANKSSGKMGVAIAENCFLQGAEVLLVRSKTSVATRYDIKQIAFETADELENILKREVKKYDILFQTAAVSDFTVDNENKGKLDSKKSITLMLSPRKKIIKQIKKWHPKIKLIAFKAQWGLDKRDVLSIARDKFRESKADAVVINDVSKKGRGFGADTNEVFVVTKKGSEKKIPLAKKQDVTASIIDFLVMEKIF